MAAVSYWRKYVHEVLVNRLGGLSLPRKSVVRLTDGPDMTLDVYRGRKTTIQPTNQPTNPLFKWIQLFKEIIRSSWRKFFSLRVFHFCPSPTPFQIGSYSSKGRICSSRSKYSNSFKKRPHSEMTSLSREANQKS